MLPDTNRGRYFLLTGEKFSAQVAKDLGLVSEVLTREQLLPRDWELAEKLARQHPLVLRYIRVLLTKHIKRLMHDLLGYGLALEKFGISPRSNRTGIRDLPDQSSLSDQVISQKE